MGWASFHIISAITSPVLDIHCLLAIVIESSDQILLPSSPTHNDDLPLYLPNSAINSLVQKSGGYPRSDWKVCPTK